MNSKVFAIFFVMALFAAVASAFGKYFQFKAAETDSFLTNGIFISEV